jgi:hypothetical protein
LTGIASLGLAFFVEFQHTQLALRQDYFRIILDQMSAWLAIASAITDIYAVYNKLHSSLNLKVGICHFLFHTKFTISPIPNLLAIASLSY